MTGANLEEPFELGHDDTFDVSSNAGEGAESMPSFSRSLIAESYERGKLEVHFHFRLTEGETTDFCAVLKRAHCDFGALTTLKSTPKPLRAPRLRQEWVTSLVNAPMRRKLWCRSTLASSLRRKRSSCPVLYGCNYSIAVLIFGGIA